MPEKIRSPDAVNTPCDGIEPPQIRPCWVSSKKPSFPLHAGWT